MRWRTHKTHALTKKKGDHALSYHVSSSACPRAGETRSTAAVDQVPTPACPQRSVDALSGDKQCPQQEPIPALCKTTLEGSTRWTESADLQGNQGGDEGTTVPMPGSFPASTDAASNTAANSAEPVIQGHHHAAILQRSAPDASKTQLPVQNTHGIAVPSHSAPLPPAFQQVSQTGSAVPADSAPAEGIQSSSHGPGAWQPQACAPGHAVATDYLGQSVGVRTSDGTLQRNSQSLEVTSECDRNHDHSMDVAPGRSTDPTRVCLKSAGMHLAADSEMQECAAQEMLQTDAPQLAVAPAPECTIQNTAEEHRMKRIVHGDVPSLSKEIEGTLPKSQPEPLHVSENPNMRSCAITWPQRNGSVGPAASEIGHSIIELDKECTMGGAVANHVDQQIQSKDEDMHHGVVSRICILVLCYKTNSKLMRCSCFSL